jgi:hypothetical protein
MQYGSCVCRGAVAVATTLATVTVGSGWCRRCRRLDRQRVAMAQERDEEVDGQNIERDASSVIAMRVCSAECGSALRKRRAAIAALRKDGEQPTHDAQQKREQLERCIADAGASRNASLQRDGGVR